ncbi:SpoVK/Ycf46/Vps4 family AAA+-type ATPase [Frigoribacterium sp. PvP054]|uniref:ATP-binding protein n=1 Tax=Frigoribacterium sp. PvP054 TaxID=3156438 RepID=UPI003392230F
MHEALIRSLRLAVEAAPGDVPLRVHLGRLLLESGVASEALGEAARALSLEPTDQDARALMVEALASGPAPVPAPAAAPADEDGVEETSRPDDVPVEEADADRPQAGATAFDWDAAERQVTNDGAFRLERPDLRLSHVGGMQGVKHRLESAFLAPLRHPELREAYGKSLRGGLLMYGPPGCGKTHIARALAGELDASFLSVGLTDLLDPYFGGSERNVHEAFEAARRHAPCVLFMDEMDAVGPRRSQTQGTLMRSVVNQLLVELDGVAGRNEGVFVLAATNRPWDVEPALRRPGRFDRTVLVLPPDADARRTILQGCLVGRPAGGVDVESLLGRTEGFSGADLAYVCELAAERALMDSVSTGRAREITTADLDAAVRQVVPSAEDWLRKAKNVVRYGVDDGTYDELRAHLDRKRTT